MHKLHHSAFWSALLFASTMCFSQEIPHADAGQPHVAPTDGARARVVFPSQRYLTKDQQVRLGYGLDGLGPRFPKGSRYMEEAALNEMAAAGDAGAAHMLWQKLQSAERMPEAEQVALDQARINGHTFLLDLTAGKYDGESNSRSVVIWKVCKELGDALCAERYERKINRYAPDPTNVEREANELLSGIRNWRRLARRTAGNICA